MSFNSRIIYFFADDIDTSSTSKSPEEDIDSSTPKSSPVDKDKSTPKSSAGLPPSSEAVSTWSTPAFTFGTPLPGPVLPAQPTIATKPPKKGCCGPSGEHLGHGDSWGTGCIMCTCNGNTGQMECGSYPCEEVVCGANEVKVFGDPSNQSGKSCCGYCAPLTCKHNGTYYQINESFRDPNDQCLVYTCSEAGLTAEAKRCPPQACTPERRTYDADGCCYKCDTNCRPTPAILFIEKPFRSFARTQIYKTCKAKVSISTCTGQCERSTRYDDQSTEVRVDCKCCQEEKHKERSIQLDCSDGTKEKHTFKDIASCACKSCN
ncbi:integumentary mucin B.1-like isoform X2 [Aquarana catesbeiana]|uniref:integumentary mucin B.1-like isoform X2 n=1 Tax=Aquarana catesbeiana TaxID=8400 RepID=UPI003CC9307B